jgi:transcriptional regulator with GAF, ATPase, and Fis domain/tetratricopeptide (TPR) repeat protein
LSASENVVTRRSGKGPPAAALPAVGSPDLARLEEHLGDLAVEREIARTPRTAVYRVRLERRGDVPLALKIALQPSDRDDLARFRHEARLLSEVRHPNVVEVHEVGVLEGGYPFLVMELVEPYRIPERPDAETLYDLAIQAAAGLAHIHHHRVVHLDVKSGNLGVAAQDGEERLRILDFGLSQSLVGPLDRSIRGTLAYTAPEVLLQDRFDHRADLYSLGLTLFEIATGSLPSAGGDREAILHHLGGERPDLAAARPDLPAELAAIVDRLLRRDPRERFASAGRLLEALGEAGGREIDPGELTLGTGGVLASRLVGRREAVERLSAELDAARRGEGRAVVVAGPEGSGKSRLLRELRLLASIDGARVAAGRASAEGGRPLQPFLEILAELGLSIETGAGEGGEPRGVERPADRPTGPTGPTGPNESGARFRTFQEIARKLDETARAPSGGGGGSGVADGPLVLLVEDLHLAGRESRELLSFLASDLGPEGSRAPVLIVASRRDDQVGETGDEDAAAGEDNGTIVLRLAPLTSAETVELADASLGVEEVGGLPGAFYDWLHDASGGLPGRVQRLLSHLMERGDLVYRRGEWKPRRAALARLADGDAAEALDQRRLEFLDEDHRELLEAAAVVAEPFRASILARVVERPVEEIWSPLTELAEQGFLDRWAEPEGASYAVAGGRLRDGLYTALDPGRRAELHRRLGRLLARRVDDGAGELAARAAEHLWRSGEREAVLPYLTAAARDAVAIHGHAEAATLFGRAAEAAEAAGDAAAAREARSGRARALALTGQSGRALREYQRLLDDLDGAGGHLESARGHLEKARLHGRLGEHSVALSGYEAGLAALEKAGDDTGDGTERAELAIALLHGKSVALRDLGRPAEAFDTARGALRRASGGSSGGPRAILPRQRALLVNTLAMMSFARGDWRRAGLLAHLGLRGALDPHSALLLRNTLAMVRWKTGDFDAASALYSENLAAADALNDPWVQLGSLNNLGVLRCSRGHWTEARRLLTRALEMNRRMGAREGEALTRINLGEVEEVLGDWRRARRHARRALALLESSEESPDRVAAQLLLASLARKSGDADEAVAWIEEADAGAEAANDEDLRVQVLLQRGLLALHRGDLEPARDDLERALDRARASGTEELLGRILAARAELALAERDRHAAARAIAEAREVADALDDRLARGRLLTLEARSTEAANDGRGAPGEGSDTLFQHAVAALEEVAAPYETARALYAWGLSTRDRNSALERMERARDLFDELGAGPDAGRARGAIARIREHRAAPGAGAADGVDGADGVAAGPADATLVEVMKVINSSLDQDQVMDRTMDLALERLGGERGMIVLQDPLTRELEVAVARNLGTRDQSEDRKLSESVVRRVIEANEPVLAVDALADRRFAGAESIIASHILSILCVPLAIRSRLAGAIYVDHCKSKHLFDQGDLDFLTAFADGAAVAIENARLFGQLEEARRRLLSENESLKREIFASHHLGSLIGKSRAIEELKSTLERVAQSTSTVLIRGESGTGKGLVARIIHNVSPRREGPFVQFNCAALPETLVESELFGHEKGAFTGATDRKPGRFELADGGSVFLDEIGKVSRAVQAKLLRVVEDKEFERVGGTRTQRSDVRIVAATNLDLEQAIAEDEFREDLYYRLNIIPIVLPPLRERREDIPYLARHFVERIGRDLGQAPRELDRSVIRLFEEHAWPGNVRELEAAIHRALVLSSRQVLGADDFRWIAAAGGGVEAHAEAAADAAVPEDLADGGYQRALDAFDRQLVRSALATCEGKIRETARLLGIARNTLKAKLERYGLKE